MYSYDLLLPMDYFRFLNIYKFLKFSIKVFYMDDFILPMDYFPVFS